MGTLYIGLDVHKLSIAVSTAEDGRDGAVRFLGEIRNTPTDVAKLAKRLARDGSQPGYRRPNASRNNRPFPGRTQPRRNTGYLRANGDSDRPSGT